MSYSGLRGRLTDMHNADYGVPLQMSAKKNQAIPHREKKLLNNGNYGTNPSQ